MNPDQASTAGAPGYPEQGSILVSARPDGDAGVGAEQEPGQEGDDDRDHGHDEMAELVNRVDVDGDRGAERRRERAQQRGEVFGLGW